MLFIVLEGVLLDEFIVMGFDIVIMNIQLNSFFKFNIYESRYCKFCFKSFYNIYVLRLKIKKK